VVTEKNFEQTKGKQERELGKKRRQRTRSVFDLADVLMRVFLFVAQIRSGFQFGCSKGEEVKTKAKAGTVERVFFLFRCARFFSLEGGRRKKTTQGFSRQDFPG
jgi:hypothetical protein